MIKRVFLQQATAIVNDQELTEDLWNEIDLAYTGPDRHFHNLAHLEHLLRELEPLRQEISDWTTLIFSLCYHDAVYDVSQNAVLSDNEERSAAFATRHLQLLAYPAERIERCRQRILATQKHSDAKDKDTNFFTDADLSILGQPWPVYDQYKNDIRREFDIYPVPVYNTGRRKVLNCFYNLHPLYKTDHFRLLYEGRAKENIRQELLLLQE